jgi:hypothetical protein
MFDVRGVGIIHQADHVIVEHAKPTRELLAVLFSKKGSKATKAMVVVALEVGKKQKPVTIDGIHESTISLRFLGIILRFLRLHGKIKSELCVGYPTRLKKWYIDTICEKMHWKLTNYTINASI